MEHEKHLLTLSQIPGHNPIDAITMTTLSCKRPQHWWELNRLIWGHAIITPGPSHAPVGRILFLGAPASGKMTALSAPLPTLALLRLLLATIFAPPVECSQPATTVHFILSCTCKELKGELRSTPRLFKELCLALATPFSCNDTTCHSTASSEGYPPVEFTRRCSRMKACLLH